MSGFHRGVADIFGRLRRYAAKTTQNSKWLNQQADPMKDRGHT